MIIPGSCVLATSYIHVKFYVKKNLKNSKLLSRMFSCGFSYSYFLLNAKFVFLITPQKVQIHEKVFTHKEWAAKPQMGFMRSGMGFVRMKHALNPLVFHWFSSRFWIQTFGFPQGCCLIGNNPCWLESFPRNPK